MNADLDKLIQLQRAAAQLQGVEAQLSQVPKDKAVLEAGVVEERARLDAAKSALMASQKARKEQEAALQDLEQKRSKYKGQLMDVKTNKEYTAMLHEIEAVEREIRTREDVILAEMEKAESLQGEVKHEEQAFKAVEESFRSEGQKLDQLRQRLQADVERLRTECDAIAATLSDSAFGLYSRVAKLRGVAVAEARDGACQVCHVKLRLQFYSDIKKNEEIVQCPSCNRILFFDPAAVAVPTS